MEPTISGGSVLATVLSCVKPYKAEPENDTAPVLVKAGKGKVKVTGKARRAAKRAADPTGFKGAMKTTIRKETKAKEKSQRQQVCYLALAHPLPAAVLC